MKLTSSLFATALLASSLALHAQNQTPTQQPAKKGSKSAVGEYGSGVGDAGKGAGKGVGTAAVGVGKGAGDVATLHPVKGAEAIGKGGAVGAKDVGVGAAKGAGKVVKGTGKILTHPF